MTTSNNNPIAKPTTRRDAIFEITQLEGGFTAGDTFWGRPSTFENEKGWIFMGNWLFQPTNTGQPSSSTTGRFLQNDNDRAKPMFNKADPISHCHFWGHMGTVTMVILKQQQLTVMLQVVSRSTRSSGATCPPSPTRLLPSTACASLRPMRSLPSPASGTSFAVSARSRRPPARSSPATP